MVEDDGGVRRLIARMLRRLGYVVLAARDEAEVIDLFQSAGDSIQVVLADVVMPEKSGPALVNDLRQRGYHFKVLFMSGHTDTIAAKYGVLDTALCLIRKPFSSRELGAKIREMLSNP